MNEEQVRWVVQTAWHQKLSTRLVIFCTLILAVVTAANVLTSGSFFCHVEQTVVAESTASIKRLQAQVARELQRSGEAIVRHAAQALFYRQLAYLHEHETARKITTARELADFCISDVGYQRLVSRKFFDYGYSNASVFVGPALISTVHAKQDLLGKDLFELNGRLTPEERRVQLADRFEEHWKDRRTGGIYYEQTATFRPPGLPPSLRRKYAYHVFGQFNGIWHVVEVTTYIEEFCHASRQMTDAHQKALSRVQDSTTRTSKKYASRVFWISVVIFCVVSALLLIMNKWMVEGPITCITAGLERFSKGEFEQPISTGTSTELRAIEEMSNRMAADLAQSLGELRELATTLEERVETRTKELHEASEALRREKEASERLLLNVLPEKIANRLKGAPEQTIVEDYASVTVLFTDFKGFTKVAETATPERLIRELNEIFGAFDQLATQHQMEKIKTIGDAYFAVGGLPERNETHPIDAVRLGLAMRDYMARRLESGDVLPLQIRIGIHTGPVIAGIIGRTKFAYDLWGDTVNIASRMESAGEAGKVNVSEATFQLINDQFVCTARGMVPIKGKEDHAAYFVCHEQSNGPESA